MKIGWDKVENSSFSQLHLTLVDPVCELRN